MVRLIWDVPAFNVKLVDVKKLSPTVAPSVTVLAPKDIVRMLLLLEDIDPAVTLNPAVSNAPFVTVIPLLIPMFKASASCTVPP